MRMPLGLRSRVLTVTMPVVVLASAAIAALVYLSLGGVLESSARDLAETEAREIALEVARHPLDDLVQSHIVLSRGEVVQVVDLRTGRVVETSDAELARPLVEPRATPGRVRLVDQVEVPDGAQAGEPAVVAVNLVTGVDGRRYAVLVAIATRPEGGTLARAAELVLIGVVGLVALAAGVTTFAVGQALRPVERLRHQVDALAASGPAPTLEVPAGGDELARLAETMNRVLARLQGADAARRAFVADAGHELRSPLATIRVLLDRLAEDRPVDERRDVAARAAAEVDRLVVLVQDLLALAAADERAMHLTRTDVDLDDLVLAEAGALRARGMPLTVAVEPVRVVGDEHKLGSVVRNLIENAGRHMVTGARVRVGRRGSEAVLVVDNDGPPVPEDQRQRIFERFVRLDDSRTRGTGGTGLGLAIVAEVVAAHGGTVSAAEAPDGWCRFEVTLPRAPEPG